jgi:hypothetical protein
LHHPNTFCGDEIVENTREFDSTANKPFLMK